MKTTYTLVVLSVISATLGFVLGFAIRLSMPESEIERELSEAIELNMVIGLLNKGEVEAAKRFLNLKLDTKLLEIDSSLANANEENRRAATNEFRAAATARQEYPFDNSQTPEPIRVRVAEILSRKGVDKEVTP